MSSAFYLLKATVAAGAALFYLQVAWEAMRDYRWRCGI